MRPRVLLLDDQARRADVLRSKFPQLVWATTSAAAIEALRAGPWDLVLLDYDLAEGDCGLRVAEWIADSAPSIGQIVVHSTNLMGAGQIMARLEQSGIGARYVPFTFEPGGPFNL